MRWIALFDDPPAMQAVRRAHEPAHLAYLAAHQGEILLAGGLRDQPGGVFTGGLWVMEVASRERAVELIEADPYFLHGSRPYRLQVWGKAFADREVRL